MAPNSSLYLETISHMTNNLPYSVHTCHYDHPKGDTIYLHWHPEAEFLYSVQGCLSVMVDREEVMVNEGEAIFIPPNCLHRAVCCSGFTGCYQAFVLSPSLLETSFQQPQFQKYVRPISEFCIPYCHFSKNVDWQRKIILYLNHLMMLAEQGEREKEEDYGMAVIGFSMVIWHLFYQHHISQFCKDSTQKRLTEQMEKVFSHIHAHYGDEIGLGELAKMAHLSESQFCRSFKKLTGVSPFAYLNRYRIMQSCRFLLKTDKKISEIGMVCGFNTVSYFNREFLKIINMPPSIYRQKARENGGHPCFIGENKKERSQ